MDGQTNMTTQTSVFLQMFTATREKNGHLRSLLCYLDPMERLYATTGEEVQTI